MRLLPRSHALTVLFSCSFWLREMSTGGYQGPTADFAPTGFGSDSPEISSRNGGSASNVANPPLFAADYRRSIRVHCICTSTVPSRLNRLLIVHAV